MRRKLVALLIWSAAPCALPGQERTIEGLATRVVERAAALAEEGYVFPDTGAMIARHLRDRLRAGAFASVTTPAQLADRLTVEMQAVNGDRHLYANHGATAPQGAGGGGGPQMVRRRPGETPSAEALAWPRRLNYDLEAVQRLAGNVGYVSLFRLSSRGTDESFRVVDAAMAFLAHVDAMIIDLRRTAGGDVRMSDYLASYFFEGPGMPTLTSYSRSSDRTMERFTVRVNGAHRPAIPVFVLVGPGTASGTEDFAFIMKQTRRGTLVGGRTAGAGRLTSITPIGDGFSVSVSGGRTFDPRTGQEWERTGIDPDLRAGDHDALAMAHVAAIDRVASSTSDAAWRRALEWTRRAVTARATPVPVRAELLRAYAGAYDQRLVRFTDGRLWYQRDSTRVREELTPVDEHTFALGEATRVEFARDGQRIVAMKIISPLGQESIYPRTDP